MAKEWNPEDDLKEGETLVIGTGEDEGKLFAEWKSRSGKSTMRRELPDAPPEVYDPSTRQLGPKEMVLVMIAEKVGLDKTLIENTLRGQVEEEQ